jgi:hypothetical protein
MPDPTAIATLVTVRSTARACTRRSPSNARAMIAMRVEFAPARRPDDDGDHERR